MKVEKFCLHIHGADWKPLMTMTIDKKNQTLEWFIASVLSLRLVFGAYATFGHHIGLPYPGAEHYFWIVSALVLYIMLLLHRNEGYPKFFLALLLVLDLVFVASRTVPFMLVGPAPFSWDSIIAWGGPIVKESLIYDVAPLGVWWLVLLYAFRRARRNSGSGDAGAENG